MQLSKISCVLAVLILLPLWKTPVSAIDPGLTPYIQLSESPSARIQLFHKDFMRALKTSAPLTPLSTLYTDGLMNHIGYTAAGPSFVAFTDLHQDLHAYITGKIAQDTPVPQALVKAYGIAERKFIREVAKLGNLSDIDTYETQLNTLYRDFLVQFIKDHEVFFETRLREDLTRFVGLHGYGLDAVDRATLCLHDGWPTHETNPAKYQFEHMAAYHIEDGRTLILGYSQRPYIADRLLHIYIWDLKTPHSTPQAITYQDLSFDLSPSPRDGGWSQQAVFDDVVHFDGRILKFSGHEFRVYRDFTYDTKTNEWIVDEQEKPTE